MAVVEPLPSESGPEEVIDVAHEIHRAALFKFVAESLLLSGDFRIEHKVIHVHDNIDLGLERGCCRGRCRR